MHYLQGKHVRYKDMAKLKVIRPTQTQIPQGHRALIYQTRYIGKTITSKMAKNL